MKKLLFILVLSGFLFSPIFVFGATLYENFNTGDDSLADIYGKYWKAQTFTTTDAYKITSVKLKIRKVGNPTENLIVGVKNTSDGIPIGDDLCSGIINSSILTTGSGGAWYETTFNECILDTNTQYGIVVRLDGGDADNEVQWRYADSGGYPGGNALRSSNYGGAWYTEGWDFMFENWGEPLIPPYTIFSLTSGNLMSILAYIGELFSSMKYLIILIIGLPLAFWVIARLIEIASP